MINRFACFLFTGVVDMWGRTGGIREDRAALLASNGFAVLALAYCQYRDLPQKYDVLDLSYFENTIDWLCAHPKIKSDGVALVGLSFGGVLITLAMPILCPSLKAKRLVNLDHHQLFQ